MTEFLMTTRFAKNLGHARINGCVSIWGQKIIVDSSPSTGRVNSGFLGASRQWSTFVDLLHTVKMDGGGRPLAAGLKRPT